MRFSKSSVPPGIAALGLAVLLLLPSPVPAGDGPAWWEVRIRLETRGRYTLIRDAKDYAGEYAYETVWTGSMERDDLDYLLYHSSLETDRWELEERDGSGPVLSEKDSPVRPVFLMNYVLCEKGRLRLFFTVDGFPVPRNDSLEKFPLVLPCSQKEPAAVASTGYDDSVSEGSNDVSLDEKALLTGPVKRVFRWSWRRYQPSSAPPPAGPFFNTHEVKVTVMIRGVRSQLLTYRVH